MKVKFFLVTHDGDDILSVDFDSDGPYSSLAAAKKSAVAYDGEDGLSFTILSFDGKMFKQVCHGTTPKEPSIRWSDK